MLVEKIIISFKTEQDRIRGIAALIRSNYPFIGLERNKFIVEPEALEMLRKICTLNTKRNCWK